MRTLLAAAPLLLVLAAGCVGEAPTPPGPFDATHADLGWQELGELVFDDAHEHNVRDGHSEVARGLTLLGYSALSDDGLSLGEYTELDNEGGLIAVAITTGLGADVRVVLMSRAALPDLQIAGVIDEPGAYGDVKLDPGLPLLYIPFAGPRTNPNTRGEAFSIWDVSDPAAPVRVGEAAGAGCHMLNPIHVGGVPYVWCAGATGPLGYRIEQLPTGGYAGVPVANVLPQSDPEALRYATYYESISPLGPALLFAPHDMTAQPDPLTGDPVLVVAHELQGIRVFDIRDPMAPLELSAWRGESGEDPIDRVHTALLAKVGDRRIAFGATETVFGVPPELYVVDMTDYANPVGLATWIPPGIEHDDGIAYSLHNFQVVGERLYIANFHAGLWTLDVSDPTDPAPIALRLPVRDCGYPRPDETVLGHPLDANQFWDPIVVDGYVLGTDMACGVEVWHVDGDPAGDPAYTSFA